MVGVEQGQEASHLVVHVAEAAGLHTIAVDGDRLALERLDDEVRHHPPVVGAHALAVGVEDPHDAHVEAMLAVIGHGERLGEALGLVVDAPRPDRVDVAPVGLHLGVDEGVAVDLARRCQEEPRPLGLGQAQQVVGPQAAHLHDLDGDLRKVLRRRGARQVHDRVDLAGHHQVLGHVAHDEGEARACCQLGHVLLDAGHQVVDTDHLVAPSDERPAQVRPQEAGASAHHDPHVRPTPW